MRISRRNGLILLACIVSTGGLWVTTTVQGQRGGRSDQGTSLVAGQMAPNFALDALDGKSITSLDELRSEKPVVLFFGSYT